MIGGERRSRRGADLDATSLHGANLVVVGIASARVAGGRVAERRRASRVTSGGVASCRERFLHDVARRSGRRVVPRARRGRTRASRRRVEFGRVARARTLDARALSTRELRLRRAKLRLERGALPRARPARAKPLGRRRHVARWPDARRDLRERYRRFACPPTTGVGARASTVQEIDLLTGALIHGLVNSRHRSGCVFGPSRVARTQNRRSKYLNFADVQDSIHNDKPTGILLFSARSAQRLQQRFEGSSLGARADSSHAASSTHVRR